MVWQGASCLSELHTRRSDKLIRPWFAAILIWQLPNPFGLVVGHEQIFTTGYGRIG